MKFLAFLLAVLLGAAPVSVQADDLALTLPPVCYAVPGVPMGIWFDNVVLTEHPEQYKYEVRCALGSSDAQRWLCNPADGETGDHPLEVTVRDAAGKTVAQASTTLRVAPRQAGSGRQISLLIVGDSLTHASVYPNEIARLLSQPGNPGWVMHGQHRPARASEKVAHEGYGGWTWAAFLSRFDPKPERNPDDRTWKKHGSPFVFAGADGKPALDLPRYFREACEGQPPQVVTFLLGINDCFHVNPADAVAVEATINKTLDNADALLQAFHQAAPKAVLAVGLTTAPNARANAFDANYHGKYTRWGWKQIQHRLVRTMLQRYGHGLGHGVVLVPTELNLDPVAGYPENNAVHPNDAGYAQIGASFYSWLKSYSATAPAS